MCFDDRLHNNRTGTTRTMHIVYTCVVNIISIHITTCFSLATVVLQVQEYLHAHFPSFRYTLRDGGIMLMYFKSDITMYATEHE